MDRKEARIILESIRLGYICPCETLDEDKTGKQCPLYETCSDAHDALVMAVKALSEEDDDDLR